MPATANSWPLHERLAVIRRLRHSIADQADDLVNAVERPAGEVWASELIPLLEACRFLEAEAPRLLADRKAKGPVGLSFRGLKTTLARRPIGTVLVIGPFNYPLFLPGVQALQALAAGNRVIWKPGRNGKAVAERLRERLLDCGMPEHQLVITDESPEAGTDAIRKGVDLVIFTGSVTAAQAIAKLAAESLTPCIIEASGSDAMILTSKADLDRAAKALWFGVNINGGQTCISPRRVFVPRENLSEFSDALRKLAVDAKPYALPNDALNLAEQLIDQAMAEGAELLCGSRPLHGKMPATLISPLKSGSELFSTDLFAPLAGIIPYQGVDELLSVEAESPFALGASIFGEESECLKLASQLRAACITINDCIAPTADPRAPFGGNRLSGYGRTRGASGLLACTTEQTLIVRRGKFLPHLLPEALTKVSLFKALSRLSHSRSLWTKLSQIPKLIKSAKRQD